MNGIFICTDHKEIREDGCNGIERKIYHQIETLKNYGHNVTYFNPYKKYFFLFRVLRSIPLGNMLMNWGFDYKIINSIDFIYVRKPVLMDRDTPLFLKKCKMINKNIKILMEIPTYPYDDEIHSLRSKYRLLKDKKYRKKLKDSVDRIVTFSKDDIIFDIDTIKIPNSIKTDSIPRVLKYYHDEQINMIACSSLAYWHGYDRAIEGIAQYYHNKNIKSKKDIVLHIVGNGGEMNHYKEIVQRYNIQDSVLFYGFLEGNELDEVYKLCCIGIDSLGRHRSKVYYNSSLKGKEYCARGLIIVSGVETEFDYVDDYNYYIRVPADDTPLDFLSILDGYEHIINKKTDKVIMEEITDYAKNNFDFSVAMLPINNYLIQNGD